MVAYHVDDLGESEAKGDVESLGRVLGRSDARIVMAHEVSHKPVLHIVASAHLNYKHQNVEMKISPCYKADCMRAKRRTCVCALFMMKITFEI